MANRIIFVFAVIIAAVYIYATEQFPALEISDPLGPKAFPRLLGIGMLITAGALLMEMLRAPKTETAGKGQKVRGQFRHYYVVGAVAIWTGLYLTVFEWLGYAVATSIYLLVMMAYFHRGKWAANLLTSVLYSFISYWMFAKLLDVQLTRGILPF